MRKKTLLFIGLIAMLFVMLVSCNTDQAVKISFDSQGGTRCKTITVDASAESIDLPTPTRDRYVFTGWYSDAELSTQVVDPIPAAMFPTEDVTYYAGWKEVTYTVFFFVEDRKVGEKVFSYGGRLTADDYPSLSSYPGYEWKKDSFEVKSDKSVFAVKKQDQGEEIVSHSVEYVVSGERYAFYNGERGASIVVPDDPIAVGDTYFYGWSSEQSGEVVTELPTVIGTADQTFYAVFRAIPDSTEYLTYRDVVENGVTVGVMITGLTSVGSYQQEIGIPTQIDGKNVVSVGYVDSGVKDLSELRVFKSTALVSVYLPQRLRSIGAWAFSDCTSLQKVVFRGGNLSYIGQGAFAGCSSLSSFEVTEQVTVLDDYVFSGLTLVKTAEKAPTTITERLPDRWKNAEWYLTDMRLSDVSVGRESVLSEVGDYAFFRCKELTSLTLSTVITDVNYLSFEESGLASLSFYGGGNLHAEDGAVFSSNGRILYYYPLCAQESFVVPYGVTQIADNAFRNNVNLSSIVFADSVLSVGQNAFRGCKELSSVHFPVDSALTTVSGGAFADCPHLTSVVFPERLVNFNDRVFENDAALENVAFVGSSVNGIGAYAFYQCVSLRSIAIPEKVVRIGDYAFYGCLSLEGFSLVPNRTQLRSIGDYAFCDCIELSAVYLPGTLEYIGAYAFCGLSRKMKMELTSNDLTSLECLGERAFANTSIMEFTLRNRLITAERAFEKYGKNYTIGKYAFADCTALKTFGFSPSDVYSVVPEGFLYGCTALTGISFTYNIKTIGDYALYGCTSLKTVSFNERTEDARQMVESIGAHAFEGCKVLLGGEGKSRLLPTSLCTLGESAFKDCIAVRNIVIPENLEVVGKKAFYGCTSLVDIAYDEPTVNKVHTFDEDCFAKCTSLGRENAVALPVNLGLRTEGKGFVKNPFFGCTSLSAFSFPNGNNNGLVAENGVVYYQDVSDLYAFPTSKQGGTEEIASSVSLIEDYAFYGATLTKLSFIDNAAVDTRVTIVLVNIGDYAFAESGLTEVDLSSRVRSVGAHAFENCKLTSLTINREYVKNNDIKNGMEYITAPYADNSIEIGDHAFHHTTLTTLVVAHRTKSIGNGAFASCYQLTDIDFTDTVAGLDNSLYLGDSVFEGDTLLTKITLPERLTYLGDAAFRSCYNLESVAFTSGRNGLSIGSYAFASNHFLYEITLPSNIVRMGKGVFSDNTRLKYFYFPERLTSGKTLEIPEEAFIDDAMLDSLVVPSYVTSIGKSAYYGTHLYEVEFEGGTEPLSIGDYAFAEAVNLTSIALPDNCVYVGESAFYGAKKLESLTYSDLCYGIERLSGFSVGDLIPADSKCYVKNYYAALGVYRPGEKYYTLTEYHGVTGDRELFVYSEEKKGYEPSNGQWSATVTYYAVAEKTVTVGEPCENAFVCRYAPATTRSYETNISYFRFNEKAYVGGDTEERYAAYKDGFMTSFDLTVDNNAFAGTSLETVVINGRVKDLGVGAFSDIQTLREVTVDGGFSALPERVFENDKALAFVYIGSLIDTVGSRAFYQSGIKEVRRLDTGSRERLPIVRIDEYAFYGSAIEDVNVQSAENVAVGRSAFENCSSLRSVVVSATGIFTCGDYSFGNCQNMTTLSFVAEKVVVGTGFAYNALSLYEGFSVTEGSDGNYYVNDHTLYTTVEGKGKIVFYPAGKTGSFCELESSVRIIGDYAFYGNKYLTGLRIFHEGSDVLQLGRESLTETEGLIVYVAPNLISLYKNEWGISDVQAYTVNLGGYVLTLQNSGKYYVTAYLGTGTDLEIRGSMTGGNVTYEITGIGRDAFKNNKTLRSVTLGAGIKMVNNGAFSGCTALKSVFVGENVTNIKNYAFYGCSELESVVFERDSSVVGIGNYAFASCGSLTSLILPEKLETIGSYAFADDVALLSVTFHEGLIEVKNNAFEDCDGLRSVVFPSTVTKLGSYLFRNCDNLVYVRCLASVVPAIDDKTFTGVPAGIFYFVPGQSLSKYNVDSKWRNHIEKIISADHIYDAEGATMFSKYVLEPIEGDSYRLVAYIGDEKNVVIYSEVAENVNVTAIGENAFAAFVENVDIRQGVTTIDANAFTYAVNLRAVDLASSVVSIGTYAFADLPKLERVTISGYAYVPADDSAKIYYDEGHWADNYNKFYIRTGVEYARASSVYSAENEYFFSERNDSLKTVGDYAFYNCTTLGSFAFPQSVTDIGKHAFSCDAGKEMALTSVTFAHDDVKGTKRMKIRIDEYAFENNTKLLSVTFNCFLSYLGEGAFKNCSNMTSLYLNYDPGRATEDMVVEVKQGAQELFKGSNKLCVIVPTTNYLKIYQSKWGTDERGFNIRPADINKLAAATYIKDDFLYSYINSKSKPPTVTVVAYLGAEKEVVFREEVELGKDICDVIRIGRENVADEGDVNGSVISNEVSSVTIPAKVETIGVDAFRDSQSLVRVNILGEGLKMIDANAFNGCSSLKTMTLPSSLSAINDHAFADCDSLNGYDESTQEGLLILDSQLGALAIGPGAFANCKGMTYFRMPAQLATIGEYAFSECTALTKIRYGDNYYLEGDVVLGESDVKLNKIGSYAFYNTALSEIILPETVTLVEQRAFAECQSLLAVYLFRDPNKSGYSDGTTTYRTVFEGIKTDNTKIYVPIGAVDRYKGKDGWGQKQVISRRFYGDFAYEINGNTDDTTTTGSVTLTAYRGADKDLTIPDTLVLGGVTYWVTAIAAYFGTPILERVIFTANSHAFSIGEYAFAGCTALKEIRLPGADRGSYLAMTEVEIGGHAFENCTALTDVHLPLYMTYLSSYLFHNCESLNEITLPSTIGEDTGKGVIITQNGGIVGNGLFYGCYSLARIRILFNYPISASLTIYGSNVFTQAGSLSECGLHIIVPSAYLANFANNWIPGRGENFSFSADTMLYGDYLMETDGNDFRLIQYQGDAEIVPVDSDFSGKEIVSVGQDAFLSGRKFGYKDFVLAAYASGWELVSYTGSEDIDLGTLTVLGRKIASISDEATVGDPNVTIKVNSEVAFSAALKNRINIIEE